MKLFRFLFFNSTGYSTVQGTHRIIFSNYISGRRHEKLEYLKRFKSRGGYRGGGIRPPP